MEMKLALEALRALAHEHRLAAFRCLVQAGPAGLAVGEVRAALAIPAATLSAHLNVMRGAGLLRERREGRVIRLFADFAHMTALLAFLTDNCCAGSADAAGECPPGVRCA
jgi:ArsR family transcriptional regulator, arsenate/arsenite/antimonite-responsive transcriptional repressor